MTMVPRSDNNSPDGDTLVELLEMMHSNRGDGAEGTRHSKSGAVGTPENQGHSRTGGSSPSSSRPSFGRLVRLSRPEWPALSRAVLLAILCIGVDLLAPAFRKIMDNVVVYPFMETEDIYGIVDFDISNDKSYELRRFTIMALVCRGISFVLGFVKAITFGIVGERVVVRMRRQLFQAMLRQDMGFFDMRTSGELSSRLGPDAMSVQMIATTGVPDLILCLIRMTVATVMMFLQTWRLSLMACALIPLVFVYICPFLPVVGRLNKDYQDTIATSSDIATQSIANVRLVRSFGAEPFASALYGTAVGDPGISGARCWWPKKTRSIYRIGAIKAVLQQLMIQGAISIAAIGGTVLGWYGYNRIVLGELTYGAYGAFMTYAGIIGVQTGTLAKKGYDVYSAMGASQRVFEIIDREPAIPSTGGEVLSKLEGYVAFENVKFSYPSRPDVQVLSDVSFQVSARSKVAFVGASGAGKTTILALIERLYDVSAGRVLLDGHDVRQLNVGWMRRRIGVVSQEPVLFGFSIRENIRFGHTAISVAELTPDVTEEDVMEAASRANAHAFISSFPQGYDTMVGERGVRLSGGQKQRIAIARSILSDPHVMLLDEATSALDSESEHAVQEALDRLMKDRTVLVVAHRLSTVINADQILMMTKEGIIDSGKHQQLLGRCEPYKELIRHQMADIDLDVVHLPDSDVVHMPGTPQVESPHVQVDVPPRIGEPSVDKPPARASRNLDVRELEQILSMNNVNAGINKDKEQTKDDQAEEQKPKPMTGFLWKLVRPEFPVLVFFVVFTWGAVAIEAQLPIWQGDIVNNVVAQETSIDQKQADIRRQMIVILVLSITIQVMHYVRVIASQLAGERAVARLRLWALASIFAQEMSFFDTQTSGALTSRLTSDTQMVQAAIGSAFIEVLVGTAKAITAIVMAFRVSWELALVTVAIAPVTALVLVGPLLYVMRVHVKYNDALALSTAVSTEATSSMRTVLSFGAEGFMELLYAAAVGQLDGPGVVCWWPRKSNTTYRHGVHRSVTLRVTFQVAQWIALSCLTLNIWYAYHLILTGRLTFGDVYTFVMYGMQIGQGVAFSLGAIGGCVAAKAALKRIFEIYSRQPAIANFGGERPADLQMDVRFENVIFSYPSRPEVRVLDGLSFVVPANTSAAFVGSSGSGKSTLFAVLQRFYEASAGCVLLGGHDVTTLDASWMRRRIGIVQQEPVLFGFNIRENIAYGRNAARIIEGGQPVTDVEVQRVSEMANAHSFISEFPEEYRTLVGERGVQLSGGQKQRVAVARALLIEPPILLLDEATSALDAESEHLVQQAINKAMEQRTVLVVAHRLSSVRHADKIHVLADGKLVESGKHQELLDRSERYHELMKHQLQLTDV